MWSILYDLPKPLEKTEGKGDGHQYESGERTSEPRLNGMICKPSPVRASRPVKIQQTSLSIDLVRNPWRVPVVSEGTAVRALTTSMSTTAMSAMDENRAFIWHRRIHTWAWIIYPRPQVLRHCQSDEISRPHQQDPARDSATTTTSRENGHSFHQSRSYPNSTSPQQPQHPKTSTNARFQRCCSSWPTTTSIPLTQEPRPSKTSTCFPPTWPPSPSTPHHECWHIHI